MPQGHKKVPFSTKQKKKQLAKKRDFKREANRATSEEDSRAPNNHVNHSGNSDSDKADAVARLPHVSKLSAQPVAPNRGYDPNRFKLHFARESKEVIAARKLSAQRDIIKLLPENVLELDFDQVFASDVILDMPIRPDWNYKMAKAAVEAREEEYFRNYLSNFFSKCENLECVTLFEMNLETWRQLWRVLEMSEILLLIADIRHPVLHFPPSLYHHITNELQKPFVLILNKVDLVPAEVSIAWKNYLSEKFPKLQIVLYSTNPGQPDPDGKFHMFHKKKAAKDIPPPVGLQELLQACKKVKPEFDYSSWTEKMEKQITGDYDHSETVLAESDRVLTIGCIGHPNVGKSSVMNSIIGKKVVSTSRTPGHTKHFQTYFVTSDVQLCDCPGLVFPSMVDRQQQIMSGLYPIAQVQEPYTPVGFIAQRLDLVKLLGLRHPENESAWTAWDICEAYAIKRGFRIARTGSNDVYRAANNLLRLTVEGKIVLAMLPPGFIANRRHWATSQETRSLLATLQPDSKPPIASSNGVHQNGDDRCDDSISDEEPQDSADEDSPERKSGDSDGDDEEEPSASVGGFRNTFAVLLDSD